LNLKKNFTRSNLDQGFVTLTALACLVLSAGQHFGQRFIDVGTLADREGRGGGNAKPF